MKTLKLSELDYHFVKLSVVCMFADLVQDDEELCNKYSKFMDGWVERTEQQGESTGVREYVESRDLGIEALYNLLKQLDK